MTQTTDPTTAKASIEVNAPQQRAFEVFTRDFGSFKPPDHNLLAVPIAETVVETHVGGHIIDRGTDGSECRWARVLAYEPPDRFMFSWDIGPTWQIETDPTRTSEVEVTFSALAEERTRVDIEHRHLDRHGDGWTGIREGVSAGEGWPLYLNRYADLLSG
jgi:uncharacterized protein YndB with AHSA1/START domain